jgi:class 3 adenylate cyclase
MTTRRLAAILAADVVGYSAMVGADEPVTLARVRALRADVIEPLAATHEGRLFKTTGDGFFVEFASAVQALRCAISIQDTLRAEADGLRLGIGVHQGEVVPDGDDLMGDGVIIAARLEPLAEPGGICISTRVREDASGKMALEVDDLGEPELKNISARIRVFRVRFGAAERPTLPLPDKPSLVVLPFQNMSGDPEQEYFADGMVEEITTGLSRIRSLFVIARNSAFTYKGRAVDVRQVGRELGVRYVLEGSVRKAGIARAHHGPVGRRHERGASLGGPVRRHPGGRLRITGPGDRKRGRGDRTKSPQGGDPAGAAEANGESAGVRPHAACVTALLHRDPRRSRRSGAPVAKGSRNRTCLRAGPCLSCAVPVDNRVSGLDGSGQPGRCRDDQPGSGRVGFGPK